MARREAALRAWGLRLLPGAHARQEVGLRASRGRQSLGQSSSVARPRRGRAGAGRGASEPLHCHNGNTRGRGPRRPSLHKAPNAPPRRPHSPSVARRSRRHVDGHLQRPGPVLRLAAGSRLRPAGPPHRHREVGSACRVGRPAAPDCLAEVPTLESAGAVRRLAPLRLLAPGRLRSGRRINASAFVIVSLLNYIKIRESTMF